MTTTSVAAQGSLSAGFSSIDIVYLGQVRTGPFMLTLCQMEGPVSIRPPQSPQLKRFTFFTTSTRRDGGEQIGLHMGYFETLTHAQSLLEGVRRRFPHAIATRVPAILGEVTAAKGFAPVADESLTDTQVMKILETRGAATARSAVEEASRAQIGVLRPEDTSVRRALKDAVVEGAPVYFAVQLDWSERPINTGRVSPLPLFKSHTLYVTESRREGRCRHFLRLGFFADAASAKEAAFSVRSKFTSAVVVAVTEEEITRAHETSGGNPGFADSHLPIDNAFDRSAVESSAPKPRPLLHRLSRNSHNTETLEQTLETLAAREMWNDPDSLSETGVRHLKVEVMEPESGDS